MFTKSGLPISIYSVKSQKGGAPQFGHVKRLRCSPDSILKSAFKHEPHMDYCKPISPAWPCNALTPDQ